MCESGSLSAERADAGAIGRGLLSAARDNDLEGACEYLRRGANVEAQESEWRYYKRTALMIAATDGHLDLAKLLHANGADVNRQGGNYHNRVDSVAPSSGNRRMSALHYAAGAGHKDFVEWLLAEGADLHAQQTIERDALWEAAFWGRVDIVKLFLSLGANVNAQDVANGTPFTDTAHHPTYWARYGNPHWGVSDAYARPSDSDWVTVLSLLVSSGADVNARYTSGYSALDIAVSRGNAEYAELLRGYGVRCFVQTGPLCGAVHVAVDFSSSGSGTVSAEGGGEVLSVGGEVRQGATVMFTAAPAAGHYVSGWSGNCAEIGEVADGLDGAAKSCAVSAASDLSVRAEFSEIPSLAGPLCPSGSLSANGLTQAQLNAGLITAAGGGDLAGVCEHLRRGAEVDGLGSSRRWSGWSALMVAAGKGRLEVMRLLLANGAQLDGRGVDGWTALHRAAGWGGQVEAARLLLDRGASVDAQADRQGAGYRRPLYEAAHWGRADVAELLLAHGADANAVDVWDITPLHGTASDVAQSGSAAIVSLLLSHGANLNPRRYQWNPSLITRAGDTGHSPLDDLVARGYGGFAEAARILRDAGGKCFVETGPLCGVAEVVTAETVCESGSLSANGLTQAQLNAGLITAAGGGDLAGVCEHLRRGAEVDGLGSSRRWSGWSALMVAAGKGRLEVMRLLLANGAQLDGRGVDGWTALHRAAGWGGQVEAARLLLDRGASVDAQADRQGAGYRRPLYEAAHWGRADVAELLLAHGADANAVDVWDITPLHGTASDVAQSGSAAIVSLLLSHGANLNPRRYQWNPSLITRAGDTGHSPLDDLVARGYGGFAEAARILRDAGGKCFVETGPLCGEVHVAVGFSSSGSGTVSAEGGGDALSDGDDVRQGATVMFTATPAAGHYVSGWSGNCAEIGDVADGLDGTAKFCAVSAASDLSVRAEFSEIPSLAGPLCASGSLSANGLTQAQLDAGLLSAARDNDLEGACEYLRRGANVEAQESEWRYHKRTALMIAATDGRLDLAKLLRANGADVNRQGGNYHNSQDSAAPSNGNRRMSALHYASGAGHKDFVEWLLAEGADLHAKQTIKRDALWEAAFWGRVDIVKLFLSLGANVNARDVANGTPFLDTAHHSTYWARYGNQGWGVSDGYAQPLDSDWATVISLLVSHGTDVNARYTSGYSALDVAVSRGNAGSAEVLRGYGVRCFVQTGPLCGEVHVAVNFSSSGAGTVSAEGGGGALSDGGEIRQGATVMFTATPAAGHYVSGWSGNCAEIGDVADGLDGTAKFCAVSAASDLSVRAEFSEIPSLAGPLCASGSLSANGLTQAQLDAGLLSAARDNDLEGACEYLRRGANVEAQESEWRYHKRTALMIAATDGRLDLAKLLRANGADVNRQGGNYHNSQDSAAPSNGNRRMSALHYASGAGHKDFVEWLLAEGADLHAKQTIKRDALWEAAFWGRVDIVKLFLSLGANVNARDVANGTPFLDTAHHSTYWARYGNQGWGVSDGYAQPLDSDWATVISLLVSHGTDVNARYTSGYSALDVAVSRGNAGSAEVLRGYGVRCFVQTGPLCGEVHVAVNFSSSGAGTVSAEGDGGALSDGGEIRQGATVMFTATPAAGHYVSGWSGNCAEIGDVADGLDGAAKSCAAAADSDLSVRAEFSEIPSLAGPLCPSESLSANGLTTAELNMTLRLAARGGDAARACEALRRGAEVNDNLDDSEFTPLQEAVSGGHLEAAKVLLANGAEVNKRKDGAGHSPLDLAAGSRDGEAEIAALLRNADGRCFLETGPLCQSVPVATPDPVTVVNTVAATVASTVVATVANTVVAEVENTVASTVAAGACPAGTLPTNGMTQAQLDYEFLGAVLENDLEGACEYLRRGANIEIREDEVGRPHNLSALMIAAGRGGYNYPDMTRLLLANGAKTDARDGSGWVTALHIAAVSDHTETAALILDWGGDVNVLSSAGDPPLYQAAHWGRADMVRLLLSRGADPDIQADTGVSPLHGAASNVARSGSAAVVSLLLSYDADPNLPRSRSNPGLITRAGETGHSPLDDLVARGYGNYAEAARILRDAGGKCFVRTGPLCQNVPVATPDPVTVVNTVAATVANTVVATVAATVIAAVENTVASTVAAGSCPAGTLDANGMTQAQLNQAMLGAVEDGDLEEVCEYLRRGADVNTYSTGRHAGIFALVFVRDNVEMAKLLLENGANVNRTGPGGDSRPPLFFTGWWLSPEVVRLYLSHGANPNFGGEVNWNPLHEAAYYNKWEIMKVLLTGGADPNIQTTRSGWRNGAPLHYVFDGTRSDSALAVSVLVAGDADVNLRDNYGRSALDLAANSGDAASAEILRAAGGQCFVLTSSLCGSAPASAASAESAPATDRLRERFAGAFNPSPAFGDAFGAASGSSQRFLGRLDSLMRSASGSGGNAWDSFAGWQRENEHGRMWFSTGQRGDFGFGAGVGGAGGDLSASPFAAMVGNGMLAGGETGLGADGKLRIAAFADYQARSLLDGTDRQWTKWAASGTAIETAMTEAERFSGLAENQTRGAMTEIHLGGDELGVALQAGAVSESDAMLSGTADDENLRGLRARTAFAGLSGAANLFGSGWRLRGSAHLGRSWAESESMLRDGDLWASAFSAGLERGGWLYSDDGFILRVSQPLRVESLEMELIGESGASRLGADPSGRQLDVDAAYRLPLSGGGWLLLSAGVRRDGGHTSSSDLEAGALFSVERGF